MRVPPLSKADGVGRSAAFGGPAAHVALFQKDIVEKERWMTPEVFTELLALGQCLPGPTSTQVTFPLALHAESPLAPLGSTQPNLAPSCGEAAPRAASGRRVCGLICEAHMR